MLGNTLEAHVISRSLQYDGWSGECFGLPSPTIGGKTEVISRSVQCDGWSGECFGEPSSVGACCGSHISCQNRGIFIQVNTGNLIVQQTTLGNKKIIFNFYLWFRKDLTTNDCNAYVFRLFPRAIRWGVISGVILRQGESVFSLSTHQTYLKRSHKWFVELQSFPWQKRGGMWFVKNKTVLKHSLISVTQPPLPPPHGCMLCETFCPQKDAETACEQAIFWKNFIYVITQCAWIWHGQKMHTCEK
jgi:hypothetical protein